MAEKGDPIVKAFAASIDALRPPSLTPAEWARRAGYSPGQIGDFRNHGKNITVGALLKLAEAIGVELVPRRAQPGASQTIEAAPERAEAVRALLALNPSMFDRAEAVIDFLAEIEEDDAGYLDSLTERWAKKRPEVLARLAMRRLGRLADAEEAVDKKTSPSRARK